MSNKELRDELDAKAEEIVSRIYWYRGQLPPKDWREDWPKIREQIIKNQPLGGNGNYGTDGNG
jgi:hypothetical protein